MSEDRACWMHGKTSVSPSCIRQDHFITTNPLSLPSGVSFSTCYLAMLSSQCSCWSLRGVRAGGRIRRCRASPAVKSQTRHLWLASAGDAGYQESLAPVEGWLPMRVTRITSGLLLVLLCAFGSAAESTFASPVEAKRNNLVTELLH